MRPLSYAEMRCRLSVHGHLRRKSRRIEVDVDDIAQPDFPTARAQSMLSLAGANHAQQSHPGNWFQWTRSHQVRRSGSCLAVQGARITRKDHHGREMLAITHDIMDDYALPF